MTIVTYIGKDPSGVRRVWGMSETLALQAAKEYLAHRPDCGPLLKWKIVKETNHSESPNT